jgi:hypothetical protein
MCIPLHTHSYIGDGFVGDWYEATALVRDADLIFVVPGMLTKESKDRFTLSLEQSQDALVDLAVVTSQSKATPSPVVVVMTSPGVHATAD